MASTDSTPVFQDSFEFPRQNEDGTMEPAVMQFQASQSLFNPNGPRPNARQRKRDALIDAVEELAKLYEKNQITMEDLIERLDAQHQILGYSENHVYRTWGVYVIHVQNRFDERLGTFASPSDERIATIQRIFNPDFCINRASPNNQPGSSSEQNESINDNVSTDSINADEMVVEEEEQPEIAAQSNQARKRRRKGAARLLTVKRTKKSTSNAARSISMDPSLARIQPRQRSRTVARSVPPQNLQNINDSDARNPVLNSNGLSPANGHRQQQQPQPTRIQPSRANIRQIRERSVPVPRGVGNDGSNAPSQVQNTVLGRSKSSQQQPAQGQLQQQQHVPLQANAVQQPQAMMPQVERQRPVVPQSPPVQQHLIPEGHQQASSDVRQPVQQPVVDPPVHQVQQSFAPAWNQLAPQQLVQQPVVHVAAAAAPLQQPQHLPQNLGGPELHQNLEQQQQQVVPQNRPPPGIANNIIDHIRQLPPPQPFGAAIQTATVGNRLPDHNAYYGLLEQINNNQRELIINLMSTNLELSRATFSAMSNILGQNGNNNNNQ